MSIGKTGTMAGQTAMQWLRQAAEQGYWPAQLFLGLLMLALPVAVVGGIIWFLVSLPGMIEHDRRLAAERELAEARYEKRDEIRAANKAGSLTSNETMWLLVDLDKLETLEAVKNFKTTISEELDL